MTDSDRIRRIEVRQDQMITAVTGLTEIVRDVLERVSEALAILKEPPSGDMEKLIAGMAAALAALETEVGEHGKRIEALPGRLAEAVRAAG